MSGYADQSREEGVDLRLADRFIEKPISLIDLPKTILELLDQPAC